MEEMLKNVFKSASINISIEGWPCAVAILGISAASVFACKIKVDAGKNNNDKVRIAKVA